MNKKVKSYKEFINESSSTKDTKIIIIKNNNYVDLFVTYAPNSGTSLNFKYNDIEKIFWTNDPDDDNYNFAVEKIKDWAINNIPIMKINENELYLLPVYVNPISSDHNNFDCWGGSVESDKNIYMLFTTMPNDINIVKLFQKKNEALSWMKSNI